MAAPISEIFLSLQFPILDNRSLLDEEVFKLEFPTPPTLIKKDFEFLRNFGQVKYRHNQESLPYLDEELFCQCNNLLKFPLLEGNPNNYFKSDTYQVKRIKTFRRFFSDGGFVSKFEIIFIFYIQCNEEKSVEKKTIILDLINKVFELPVKISKNTEVDLIMAGKKLAEACLHSTTKTKAIDSTKKWWVGAGDPSIFTYFSEDLFPSIENTTLEKVEVSAYEDLALYNFPLTSKFEKKISIWCCPMNVSYQSNVNWRKEYNKIREIKIIIFRIHGYLQFLKQLFPIIMDEKLNFKKGTKQSDLLQKFLVDIYKFLKHGNEENVYSKTTKIFLKTDNFLGDNERDALIQKFKEFDFRPNTQEKVNEIVNDQDFEQRKQEARSSLKQMIGELKFPLFFDILTNPSYLENSDTNEAILFKTQYLEIENAIQKNTLIYSDALIQKNKIADNLLSFIDKLDINENLINTINEKIKK